MITGLADIDAVRARALEALRPPRRVKGSIWADEHFYLSPESAAEPGRWKTLPYQREILDAMTDPAIERVSVMKSARVGYALALGTPIATLAGWSTMGDIALGDALFDESGALCRVVYKSPVYNDHECYELAFCDGSTVVADAGHRWFVETDTAIEYLSGERGSGRIGRPKPGQLATFSGVVATSTIANALSRSARTACAVPLAKPIETPAATLPVPPYTLGAWLGDGHKVTPRLTVHRDDSREIAVAIEREGIAASVRYLDKRYPNNATVLFDVPPTGRPVSPWRSRLRTLGVMPRKHIPPMYLRASVEQRLELLRGLMDTDGTIGDNGRAEFTNTNEDIARGTYELVVSLGMKASIRERPPQRAGVLRQWRVNFKPHPERNPFRLTRKAARVKPLDKPTITLRRRIVSVRRVDPVPVQCIQVDSPSSLFLAGRQMVPTHNTKCLGAAIGSFVHQDPCPILVVQPTLDDADGYSKDEIAPMIRDVPVLAKLFPEGKTRDSDSTILQKRFRGGILQLVGANSGRGFRRVTRRVVAFDEVDAFGVSAGSEGDPIRLGERRAETYWNRKYIYGSTPLVAGISRIERLFLDGDQRRYYVPCTQCGEMSYLVFGQGEVGAEGEPVGHFMRWTKDRPDDAHFVCRTCGGIIEHNDKREIVEAGEWRPHAPFTGHASFHLWAAYSFSPNATWAQIAREYAKAAHEGPEALKTVVNTVLGLTWKEKGDAPPWEMLYQRRAMYRIGTCPEGVLFLTIGVDVQRDRLIYEVVGWGRGKRSWSIDAGVLPGDPADETDKGPWPALDALLDRTFPTPTGIELKCKMLAIDSGDNTQYVYGWGRKHPMTRVIATKGDSRGSALIGSPSPVEVTVKGRKLKRGYKVWPVNPSIAKAELYGYLRLHPPTDEAREAGATDPPGYCSFPQYGEDYFKQLTAEQLVTHKNKKGYIVMEWRPIPGRENHFLDCRVLSRAAAEVVGINRFAESDWSALERIVGTVTPRRPDPEGSTPPPSSGAPPTSSPPASTAPGQPQRRDPWLSNRPRGGGGWLRGRR